MPGLGYADAPVAATDSSSHLNVHQRAWTCNAERHPSPLNRLINNSIIVVVRTSRCLNSSLSGSSTPQDFSTFSYFVYSATLCSPSVSRFSKPLHRQTWVDRWNNIRSRPWISKLPDCTVTLSRHHPRPCHEDAMQNLGL